MLPQGHLHPDPEPQILQLPDLRHRMLNLREKALKKRIERGAYTVPCCGEQFLPIRRMPDIAATPVGAERLPQA